MNLAFNARTIAPNSGGTKLPPGEYPFVITGDETKDGAIYFTLTVGQGNQFAGSTFKHRLGLWSQNSDEYRIAWEKLSQLCHVTGVLDLQDTAQLRGIPFYGQIENQKNSDKFTELRRVKDAQGRTPNEIAKAVGTVAGQAPQAAPTPQHQPPAAQQFVPQVSAPAPIAPPPGPQVGYPAPSSASPFPGVHQVNTPIQSPAGNLAPWGAPPSAPTSAPPQWAK